MYILKPSYQCPFPVSHFWRQILLRPKFWVCSKTHFMFVGFPSSQGDAHNWLFKPPKFKSSQKVFERKIQIKFQVSTETFVSENSALHFNLGDIRTRTKQLHGDDKDLLNESWSKCIVV